MPSTVEDECGDSDADQRIKDVPGGEIDDDRSSDDPHGGGRVAQQVIKDAPYVEVARGALEDNDADDVDREAEEGDYEHLETENFPGMENAKRRLVEDDTDHKEEKEPVDKGR